MNIRPAHAGEIEAIFQVHRESVHALCASHYTPQQIAMWLDGRDASMYLTAIGRGELWVAEDADGLAGFVEIEGRDVSKLFVRGARAGGGVGKLLLATAVDAIRAAGHRSAHLESTRNACNFYERHGFGVTGAGTFSRGNREVVLEIVHMTRHLADAPAR